MKQTQTIRTQMSSSPQLYRALWHLSAHCFGLPAPTMLFFLVGSHQPCFQPQQAAVFREKALKEDCKLPAQRQMADRQCQRHASKHSRTFSNPKSCIFFSGVGGDQTQSYVNTGLTFVG